MNNLLPRCTHFFGYCAKTKPPKGKKTDRQDVGENFRTTPNCKDDYRTCPHYRVPSVVLVPLGTGQPSQTLQTPTT